MWRLDPREYVVDVRQGLGGIGRAPARLRQRPGRHLGGCGGGLQERAIESGGGGQYRGNMQALGGVLSGSEVSKSDVAYVRCPHNFPQFRTGLRDFGRPD